MDQPTVGLAAVIDIGTNSTRLLVAEKKNSNLLVLRKESKITRLGRGVDSSRNLSLMAMEETLQAVTEFINQAKADGAIDIKIVATSAVRDAGNKAVFAQKIKEMTTYEIAILSGVEEATLSYQGALSGFPVVPVAPLVADVGGGSTELVTGPVRAVSLDVGAVRLTERYLHGNPPPKDEIGAATAYVREQLELHIGSGQPLQTLIGLGGTITCIGSILLNLPEYDVKKVHMSKITREAFFELTAKLADMPIAQRRQIPGMQLGREDIILGGAIIFQCLLDYFALSEVIVCDADIMEGVLLHGIMRN